MFLENVSNVKRFQTHRMEIEQRSPPEGRIREAAIFEVVGVDLDGPLYLYNGKKVWIALHICAVFQVIHLEVISVLSTDCFMQLFKKIQCMTRQALRNLFR